MLGWVSVDVLGICLVILLFWAGFQMALYCHIFARHGYRRVMWIIMAFGAAVATSIFAENVKLEGTDTLAWWLLSHECLEVAGWRRAINLIA